LEAHRFAPVLHLFAQGYRLCPAGLRLGAGCAASALAQAAGHRLTAPGPERQAGSQAAAGRKLRAEAGNNNFAAGSFVRDTAAAAGQNRTVIEGVSAQAVFAHTRHIRADWGRIEHKDYKLC